ncbi:MAG: hypothetical protein MJZ81_00445 [Bacteroidales bacterium]|nr:hypothetical protein [Bacteroidales bacterium]
MLMKRGGLLTQKPGDAPSLGWHLSNENRPPVSFTTLSKELQLAKKAVAKHRKDNCLVEK